MNISSSQVPKQILYLFGVSLRVALALDLAVDIRLTYPVLSACPGFPYEKVRERTLYMQVLDYDRFSRNDPIGEVSIPLNKVELGQHQTLWKDLKPCSDGSVSSLTLSVIL